MAAATRVFADHGFKSATIRQISHLAGANVASVNYHFGDKEALYQEVLKQSFDYVMTRHSSGTERTGASTGALDLRAFVEAMLRPLFGDEADLDGLHGRVLAREVIEPAPAMESWLRSLIEKQACVLDGIVRDLVGQQVDDQTVRLCGMSIMGQILFYSPCRAVAARFYPELPAGAIGVELLADHITRFSVEALQRFTGPAPRASGFEGRGDSEEAETAVHLL